MKSYHVRMLDDVHKHELMDSLTRKRVFTNLKNGESFRFFVDDQRFGLATRFVAFIPQTKMVEMTKINKRS